MANIPWPDEIAKQNADVFSSYLAPLSEEKKNRHKTRTQTMIVDSRGFRSRIKVLRVSLTAANER